MQVPIFSEAHVVAGLSFTASSVVNVHLSSSPVWTYVSPASYWHILDACTGAPRWGVWQPVAGCCLARGTSPGAVTFHQSYALRHAGNFVEDGRLDPTSPDAVAPRRAYDPQVRMWPPTTTPLVATITVSCPESYLLFQADPQTWEAGLPPRPIAHAPRTPFALVKSSSFDFSAVIADNNDVYETYLSWDVAAADTFDMRLARFHLLRQPWRQQQRQRPSGPPPAPSQRWQTRLSATAEGLTTPQASYGPDGHGGSPSRLSAAAQLSSEAGGLGNRLPSTWAPDEGAAPGDDEGFGPMPDQDRLNQVCTSSHMSALHLQHISAPTPGPALADVVGSA